MHTELFVAIIYLLHTFTAHLDIVSYCLALLIVDTQNLVKNTHGTPDTSKWLRFFVKKYVILFLLLCI